MKRNIGEFSWIALMLSFALCLAPAVCIYRLFPFQRSSPKDDATPALLEMQRQLDDLNRKVEAQAVLLNKMPPVTNVKSSHKR